VTAAFTPTPNKGWAMSLRTRALAYGQAALRRLVGSAASIAIAATYAITGVYAVWLTVTMP
jgi:hypothetical protein